MSDDHAGIEELLAGHALDALESDDAARAEELLEHHVPTCIPCRRTLEAFGSLRGDLALAADPVDPPETLRARIGRELEPRTRVRNPARIAAVTASIMLVLGLGGVTLTRLDGDGTSLTQLSAQDLGQALELASHADATTTDLGPATEVSVPGLDHFYVYSHAVPAPPPGTVYRLWLIRGGDARHVGDFVPAPDGSVVLRVEADPAEWDRVLVTTEPVGASPSTPGAPAWDDAA